MAPRAAGAAENQVPEHFRVQVQRGLHARHLEPQRGRLAPMQGGRLDHGGLDGHCQDGGFHSGAMYAAVIPPSTRNVVPFT